MLPKIGKDKDATKSYRTKIWFNITKANINIVGFQNVPHIVRINPRCLLSVSVTIVPLIISGLLYTM